MYPDLFHLYCDGSNGQSLCGVTADLFRATTIVAKIFNIPPDVAFLVNKMPSRRSVPANGDALNFPIHIIVAPIVREPDGLAMSSRNVYLSPEERRQAPVIHRALVEAAQSVAQGQTDADAIAAQIRRTILTTSLARIDYVEIVDDRTLTPVKIIAPGTFVAVAVYYGKTRLIDNVYLKARLF
jgi:pantoate--beta-alanine ligase